MPTTMMYSERKTATKSVRSMGWCCHCGERTGQRQGGEKEPRTERKPHRSGAAASGGGGFGGSFAAAQQALANGLGFGRGARIFLDSEELFRLTPEGEGKIEGLVIAADPQAQQVTRAATAQPGLGAARNAFA